MPSNGLDMTRRSKFRNTKVEGPNGMKFDSKKELKRYNELVLLERAGEISSLRRQVTFTLLNAAYEEVPVQLKTKIRFKRVCLFRETTYIADFVYYKDGEEVVEDVKASPRFQDPVYKLKKKLMYMVHNVKIKEIY